MNTRQFIKYAEENGYDSVMFTVQNGNGKHVCAGQCLDIYYEFVTIPVLGDGFIRVSDLEETIGNDIQFEVIPKKEYLHNVVFDFIIRGKDIPKDIQKSLDELYASEDGEE